MIGNRKFFSAIDKSVFLLWYFRATMWKDKPVEGWEKHCTLLLLFLSRSYSPFWLHNWDCQMRPLPAQSSSTKEPGINTQFTLLPSVLSWCCCPLAKAVVSCRVRDWLMRLMKCIQLPSHRAAWRSLEKCGSGCTKKISNSHTTTFTFLKYKFKGFFLCFKSPSANIWVSLRFLLKTSAYTLTLVLSPNRDTPYRQPR